MTSCVGILARHDSHISSVEPFSADRDIVSGHGIHGNGIYKPPTPCAPAVSQSPGRYARWLAATMLVLTGVALLIIRVSYATLWGADADQNSAYKHFAIDLFGMAVHLAAAALVVRVARRYLCSRAGGRRA